MVKAFTDNRGFQGRLELNAEELEAVRSVRLTLRELTEDQEADEVLREAIATAGIDGDAWEMVYMVLAAIADATDS